MTDPSIPHASSPTVHFTPATTNAPDGKLADAELRFTSGPLAGTTLLGFAVWESKFQGRGLHVSLPSREYRVNGESRRFDLLRSADKARTDAVRDFILTAYAQLQTPATAPASEPQWRELPPDDVDSRFGPHPAEAARPAPPRNGSRTGTSGARWQQSDAPWRGRSRGSR